ncbi:MAG: hypothetical protein RLW61_08345 [Gammaproteobacteria bacterium]
MSQQALLAILAGLRRDDRARIGAGLGAGAALWVCAALCALASGVFVCLFAYVALATALGIVWAAAVCAMALLLVAGGCVLGARARMRATARRAAAHSDARAHALLDEMLAGAAPRPLDLALASLIGGLVLGASPALRRRLADWVNGDAD